LDYIKLGPFRISRKVIEVNYKLDLLAKIKIHLVQHVAILEPVYGDHELPLYKADTYRGQEEDKWEIQRVIDHQEIDNVT
jgi:hypothetical protein